jgi:hypothetical protein
MGFQPAEGRAKNAKGVLAEGPSFSSTHFQRNHKKIIFPVAFIDPISEVAEEWHRLIVALKLINCNLRAEN